jgi:hypothetical protein
MLTIAEMTDARDKLSAAAAMIGTVRLLLMYGGCIDGARILNDVIGLLADEIAALDKAIGGARL